jgi:hypothetical protein
MSEFTEHAESIADKYLDTINPRYSCSHIEFCGQQIIIHYEESYCGCCSPDTDSVAMPIELLWAKDACERMEKLRKEHEDKEKAEADRKEARRKEQQRKSELAQLDKLKAKYPEE